MPSKLLQGVSQGSTFLRMEVCYSSSNRSAGSGENLKKPVAVFALAFGIETMQAISALRWPNSSIIASIWPSISQIMVSIDVCPGVKLIGHEAERNHVKNQGQRHVEADLLYVRMIGDLQALLEAHSMQPFWSRRQKRMPRTPPLNEALYAAGFPSIICRYCVAFFAHARLPHAEAPDSGGSDRPRDSQPDDSSTERSTLGVDEVEQDDEESDNGAVRLHGQLHACSAAASVLLPLASRDSAHRAWQAQAPENREEGGSATDARSGIPRKALRFPGRHEVRSLASKALLIGGMGCHAACLKEPSCRSWSYWGPNMTQIASAKSPTESPEQRRGAGVCVGCRESVWFPVAQPGCATGLVVARFMKDAEHRLAGADEEGLQHGHEPFYLNVEPKGGWTMTDLVGFPFSSDADMLHARWLSPAHEIARGLGIKDGVYRGDRDDSMEISSKDGCAGSDSREEVHGAEAGYTHSAGAPAEDGKDDGADKEEREIGCGGKPHAAVVYLVGHREQDLVALEESIAAVEKWLLVPHGNCYPIFLFSESWDDADTRVQNRIRAAASAARTRRQMEFLAADLSFPDGFDSVQHASPQSKRSTWGYQHMSRFWTRTIFEHARVAVLDYYLRLDTDSLLLSPLLDVFEDAARRGIKYGYRMAGKDWRGRNVGLWRFHDTFLRDSGIIRQCAGQRVCGRGAVTGIGKRGAVDGAPATGGGRAAIGGEECCRKHVGSLLSVARGTREPGVWGGFELGDETEAPMLYTNLELVDVQRFRGADVWAFVEDIDASHGIYLRNWGDAQIRWLEVATFLQDSQVHRYCHFGYQHAAAGARAFDCWQEAWVGYDCADPIGCDLRGRSRRRLVDQGSASLLIGPPVAPARTRDVLVDIVLPARCMFVGDHALSGPEHRVEPNVEEAPRQDVHRPPRLHSQQGATNRFRAFWLLPPGHTASGRLQAQGREIEIATGHLNLGQAVTSAEVERVAAGGGGEASLRVWLQSDSPPSSALPGADDMLRAALAATALVIEVDMVYINLDGSGSDKGGGGGADGMEWEQGLLVFPTEHACAQRIAGPCHHQELLHGDVTRVSLTWAPPDTGVMRSLPSRVRGGGEGGGDGLEGDVDVEVRGRQWEAVMVRDSSLPTLLPTTPAPSASCTPWRVLLKLLQARARLQKLMVLGFVYRC